MTWNGGGGDNNFSTAANWGGTAPVANDALIFGGTTRLTPSDDIAGLIVNGITFASGAGSFNVGGANALNLNGSISQASANNQTISLGLVLDNTTSNIGVSGAGTLTLGALTFGNVAQSTGVSTLNINNTVTNSTLTIRTASATANTINIAGGATWNTTGAVVVGTPPTAAGNIQTVLNVAGAGTWNATTTGNASFNVGLGSGNNNFGQPQDTLDMTGLANFVYSTGATGTGVFGVGNLVTRPASTARLANTSNLIVAATIGIGDSGQSGGNNSGGTSTLFLGAGTNVLNAGTITIGATKGAGAMQFQTTTGSVTIAGQAGGTSRVGTITLGRGSSATDTGTTRNLLLAGHTANVLANNVIVGHLNGSTGGTTRGNLTFDTGTFDVNNLTLGLDQSGSAPNGVGGTFTLGTDASSTGSLIVNSSFLMGNVSNGATGAKPNLATFTINGGTANINADIVSAKNAAATGTTLTSTINLNAGLLTMNGKNIGSAALPITALNLAGGTINGANRITATTTTLGAGLTIGGTPTFVIPENGTINSSLAPLNVNGGIEGGGPAGPGNITGAVQVNSGGRLSPGTTAVAGTLAFANDLSLTNGSIARLKLSSTPGAGNDLITVGGNLNVSGSVNLDLGIIGTGPQAGNTYTLFTYGGTLTGNESNFIVPSIDARTSYTIVPTATTPNQVQLSITGSPSLALTWAGDVNSNWNLKTTPNFKDNTATSQQFFNLDSVTFDDSSTNLSDVQVVGSLQPGGVTVNASRAYKFAGAGAIAGATTVTKQGAGTLTIVNENTYTGLTLVQGGTLQIGDGGTTGSLAGPIQNDALLTLDHSDARTISNAISGFGNLVKNGSNTLTLSGSSSYTGSTTVNGGVLQVTSLANSGTNSNIGQGAGATSDLILNNGATFRFVGGANQTTNRQFTITTAGGTIDSSPSVGAVALSMNGTGVVAYSDAGPRTLTLTGTELTPLLIGTNTLNLTINDQDSSTGKTTIVKNGNSRWQLGGNNNYSGGTIINAGGIRTGSASALGTGPVTVANGAQVYLNTAAATFANNFSIAGVGPLEAPGSEPTASFGAIRIANNGSSISGTVTLTGDARITGRSATTGGTISGQITGNFNLEFGNTGGGTGSVIIASPLNDWGGNTTVSHGTLKTGAVDVIPRGAGKGNVIINNTSATLDSTLDLTGNNQQINGLSSSGADMTRVKVLNSSGAATLSVGNNDASAVYNGLLLDGAGTLALAKVGSGTQTIAGANTYSGGTTVSGGTLRVSGAGTLGAATSAVVNNAALEVQSNNTVGDIDGTGALTVNTGTTVLNANHVRQASLNISNNATVKVAANMVAGGTSKIGTLTIGANARFDLNANKLITNSPIGTFVGGAYTGVQGDVARAYDFGSWDLPGLMTSQPNAGPLVGTTTIGVSDGATVLFLGPTETGLFAGQTVTGASTIAMYTYAGDVNFDGLVDASDYGIIDNYFQFPGTTGYANGDFNYDGVIDAGDYGIIDNTFQLQGAPIPGVNDPFASAASSSAGLSGVTAVPEPASLGTLAVAGVALLGRRRRRDASR